MPNNVNVPLFKEKGETVAQAHIGGVDEFTIVGLNSAHAVGRNTAIMVNVSNFSTDPILEEYNNSNFPVENNLNYNSKNRAFIAEVGAGFFKVFGRDSLFIFETYAGYGLYYMNRALNTQQSISYNIHRPFIQPSIGMRYRLLEVSYGLRMSEIIFSNIQPSTAFEANPFTMDDFTLWDKTVNFEHSLTISVGSEKIKGQIQWVSPSLLLSPAQIDVLGFVNRSITLGVKYRF